MKKHLTTTFAAFSLTIGLLAGTAYAASSSMAKPASSMDAMQMDKMAFAKAVAGSNAFEIESSKLALKRSKNADVRNFAEMMVKDHTAAGAEFMGVVKSENIKVKKGLAPKQSAMLKQLKGASAANFDKMYIDMQTQAHEEAVSTFQSYSAKPDDKGLGDFATKTLPTLQQHLDHVQTLKKPA